MKLLLHICCAPCSTAVIERLESEGYQVTGYFYNPNIQPDEEYVRRLNESRSYAKTAGIELIEGEYDLKIWNELTEDHGDEPEGGTRCKICYGLRLQKTAEKTDELNYDIFTTTLSISPYKNVEMINRIGNDIAEKLTVNFLESDFKKKNGYKRSLDLCRDHDLYRQDYCGCIYSREEKEMKQKNKGTIGKLIEGK